MWRKGKFIKAEKKRQLYAAYVQSHLLYMLPIYGDCTLYKLKELQTLQNRCIKATFCLDRYTPTTYLYSSGLLPIMELAKVERICYVHKLVKSLTKHNFEFTNADVHGRTTRRASRIHNFNMYSATTTEYNSSNAALMLAIDEYNSVESDVRHLASFKAFKAKVKFKVMRDSAIFMTISPFLFIN